MAKTLELRPLAYIVLGYLAAAVVAATLIWLMVSLDDTQPFLHTRGAASLVPNALASLPSTLISGVPLCLLLELVFVTPVLLAYARFRWRWLNGWTGSATGLVVGVCLCVAVFGPPHELDGWPDYLLGLAEAGALGVVVALVIRLIAVRTAQPSLPAVFD